MDPATVDLVLYHGRCPDGFGAAYAAWKLVGSKASYVGCDHGSKTIPDVTGKVVAILDFSFKRDILLNMIKTAKQLIVIDHHASAVTELEAIPEQNKIFDMNRSGATMAWQFFHPTTPVPELLLYVEDRDLWRWKLPRSAEVCAGLDTVPQNFEIWDSLLVTRLCAVGEPVVKYRNELVESICYTAYPAQLQGVKCQAVNCCGASLVSYVGHSLLQNNDVSLAVMWYYDAWSRTYKVSMRSKPDFDCSKIAVSFGGGGHEQASAFKVDHLFGVLKYDPCQ